MAAPLSPPQASRRPAKSTSIGIKNAAQGIAVETHAIAALD
ncbi:hypothetical protein ACTMTF_07805 [Nonomuraea sp. ZG12]